MTRAEAIRNMTDEELAKFLCDEVTVTCAECVAYEDCSYGRNGFVDWLQEEDE